MTEYHYDTVSSVSEYMCQDCGSLLIHNNPLTLESMKDVHKQLCIVARQKIIAAEAAKASIPKATATGQKPSIAPTPPASVTATTPAAAAPTAAAAGGGGNTTISLTGSGTNYSKVDGPIDPSFKSKRQVAGTFQGIKVWGPVDPPGQLGIW